MRIHSAITLLSVLIASCASGGAGLRSHDVKIPARFSSNVSSETGVSDAERYKLAYEEAWRTCVARFANDINFQTSEFDRAGSGWPAAALGFEDGYLAAESRIQVIRSQYGPERAQSLLQKATAQRQ